MPHFAVATVAAEQSGMAQTLPKAGVTDVSTIPNVQYRLAGARPRWFCGDHNYACTTGKIVHTILTAKTNWLF